MVTVAFEQLECELAIEFEHLDWLTNAFDDQGEVVIRDAEPGCLTDFL
jgi:hypothetical protein